MRLGAPFAQTIEWTLATANAVVRLFLAPDCVSCGHLLHRPLDGAVCPACWIAIPRLVAPFCARCGDVLPSLESAPDLCGRCQDRPPLVTIARSAGQYSGPLRAMVHGLKYERRRALAAPLGRLMRDAGAAVLDGADAVVPVPLSWRRSLDRGFNQADDLARQLGPPVWRVLTRRRHGPPQAKLPADERFSNVEGAYATSLLRSIRHSGLIGRSIAGDAPILAPPLTGRLVVLVDDVMTTGATLEACAQALVASGAREVRALTAARAVAGPAARSRTPRRPSAARRR